MKSIIATIFVRGFSAAAVYLMYMILSNTMPSEEAGKFFYYHTVITFLAPLLLLGLHGVTLRKLSRVWNEGVEFSEGVDRSWSSFLPTVVVSGLIFLATFLVVSSFGLSDQYYPSLYFCVGIASLIGGGILSGHILQSMRKFNLALFVMNVSAPLAASVLIVALRPVSSDMALLYFGVAALLVFFVGLSLAKFRVSRLKLVSSLSDIAARSSFFVVNLMILLLNWSGVIVAGVYLSPEEVAGISVGQRTAALIAFVLVVSNFILAPFVARATASGEMDKLRHLSNVSGAIMSLIGLVVILIFFIYGKVLLGFFGEEYKAFYLFLMVLSLAQLVNVITGNSNVLLMMGEHEKLMRNIGILSGVSSLLMCMFFVPILGAMGAAYSFFIAMTLQNLLSVYFVKQKIGINLFGFLFPKKLLESVVFVRAMKGG